MKRSARDLRSEAHRDLNDLFDAIERNARARGPHSGAGADVAATLNYLGAICQHLIRSAVSDAVPLSSRDDDQPIFCPFCRRALIEDDCARCRVRWEISRTTGSPIMIADDFSRIFKGPLCRRTPFLKAVES